ncbi:peptidase M16 inactive domain-containing protein [Staphylotrichum tortipilum]|uniref:Mitochondrial-processing peptidase subunit alpha n=1 Tax=Staphylotrichum tortipilum TaxID=2831512 RepID=A0AAN6RVJ3_9PEZI|nr:peptidase M16 inactive domain-containing protein [Staphylotrichum longicolle]
MLRSCRPTRLLSPARQPWRPSRPSYPTPPTRTLATAVGPAIRVKTPAPEPLARDKVTTLSNGIRVASEDLPDAFSGVGVYINAGSRYENPSLSGASHIMDRLAFKSTTSHTADEMMQTLEKLGGNVQCASSRESMMYQAGTFNSAVPEAVALLAETVRNPQITDEEIAQQVETAGYEVGEIWSKPELILPELLHTAAFKDNTLGNPLLCPEERLHSINGDVIRAYRDAFYTPERIVVAFAGVPHEEAVRLAEQHFGDMKPTPDPALSRTGSETSLDSLASESSDASSPSSSAASSSSTSPEPAPSGLLSKIPFLKNLSQLTSTARPDHAPITPVTSEELSRPAHYTGGFLSLPPQPPPLNPNTQTFTHIQLAFEGLPISSDDVYALATLQTLLGGGGSFSAGGPGKGMYSRLFTNVLNQHGWVESCVALNHSYTDSGLFGIAASCYPGHTPHMLQVLCRELHALTATSGHAALGPVEVARAKNQLRSSLLMNLESRMIELEDLGRQVQIHGHKIPVREMTRRIAALTVNDLRRVATMVVTGMVENKGHGTGAPTVVLQEATAKGLRTSQMSWEEVQDTIAKWGLGKR